MAFRSRRHPLIKALVNGELAMSLSLRYGKYLCINYQTKSLNLLIEFEVQIRTGVVWLCHGAVLTTLVYKIQRSKPCYVGRHHPPIKPEGISQIKQMGDSREVKN